MYKQIIHVFTEANLWGTTGIRMIKMTEKDTYARGKMTVSLILEVPNVAS